LCLDCQINCMCWDMAEVYKESLQTDTRHVYFYIDTKID
jgi:hypothetical protein